MTEIILDTWSLPTNTGEMTIKLGILTGSMIPWLELTEPDNVGQRISFDPGRVAHTFEYAIKPAWVDLDDGIGGVRPEILEEAVIDITAVLAAIGVRDGEPLAINILAESVSS